MVYTSVRQILKEEYSRRFRSNPMYSLRAFARDLAMPASNLSDFLKGRRGLSLQTAKNIAERLRLSPEEQDFFTILAKMEFSRSTAQREIARERYEELKKERSFKQMSLEKFSLVSDWAHFAILELIHVQGFQYDPQWIAERLGIPISEVQQCLNRLLTAGLMVVDSEGRCIDTSKNISTPSDVPSSVVRDHHRQVVTKGLQSLDNIPVEFREFISHISAIDSSKIPEAKMALREFSEKFFLPANTASNDRVYCLAIQFFPVDTCTESTKTADTTLKK